MDWKISNTPICVLNIGGKTTEIVIFINNEISSRFGLDVGVSNLLSQFTCFMEQYISTDFTDIKKYIFNKLSTVNSDDFRDVDTAIYTGGELHYMQVANYPLQENECFVDLSHPYMIQSHSFSTRNKEICCDVSIDELRCMMPDNPSWMNGARACSLLAECIFEYLNISKIIPSNTNLVDDICAQEIQKATICGSFRKHLNEINCLCENLKCRGVEILSPSSTKVTGSDADFILFEEEKPINNTTWHIERKHLRAIENCDTVIICNIGNYLGRSATVEIGYALSLNKRIIFIDDNDIVKDFEFPCEIGFIDEDILKMLE